MNTLLKISIPLCIIAALTYYYSYEAHPKKNVNVLIVGTNAMYPPFEYKDHGTLTGFEIDLIYALADRLEKKVVFKDMEFDHLLLEAQSDNLDIIAAALTPTHEQRKHILFTRPYLTNDPLMIVTLVSDQPPVDSTSLYNKQTIVNDNYTAEIYMKSQQQEHPEIQLQHLATPHEAFFALIHGHAYAYVASASTVQFFLDTYGREKFATVLLNVSDAYALAVPKSAPQMFKEVEEALNTLRADGTLTHLKEKWHLIF